MSQEGLDEWVEEQLDKGFSEDELRESLRDNGYSRERVERVFEEVSGRSKVAKEEEGISALRNWQIYTWILLFVSFFVFYLYGALSSSHTTLRFESFLRFGFFWYSAALIMAFQFLSGLYQIFSHGDHWGWWNVTSAVVIIGGFFALLRIREGMILSPSPFSPAGSLFLITIWINVTFLAISAFSVPITWKKLGKGSWLFLLVYLFVFSIGLGLNYMDSQAAIAELKDPAEELTSPSVEEYFGESDGPYRMALGYRVILPPTSNELSSLALKEAAGRFYTFFRSLKEQGGGGRTLSSPGTFCGGTGENLARIGGSDRSPKRIVASTQMILEKIRLNEESIKEGLESRCAAAEDCNRSRFQPSKAYRDIVDIAKNRRDVVKNYLGVEEVPKNFVVSRDCSVKSKEYYEVLLKNITCGGGFNAVLENLGPREISSQAEVIIYGPTGNINSSLSRRSAADLSSWSSGEKIISYPAKFREGRSYKAVIEFADTSDLTVSAYCIGGNGFCKDCGKEISLEKDLKKRLEEMMKEKPLGKQKTVDYLVEEGYRERYAYRAVEKLEEEVGDSG